MTARAVYTGVGLLLGIAFAAAAWVLIRIPPGATLTPAALDHARTTLPYVIGSLPLLVAALAFVAGQRQDRALAQNAALREVAAQRGNAGRRLDADAAARQRLEAQLTHRMLHDPLTNLANRALFLNRVGHALARAGSKRGRVAVLLLDLDDFKTINDSIGHAQGDALLIAVAHRFAGVVRQVDTLARLGGDEFALLLEVAEPHDAVATGQRLIESLNVPLKVGARSIQISASVGVTFGGGTATPESLVRDADLAMYDAKTRGKDGLRVFRPEMHAAIVERVQLGGDLQRALRNSEFHLLYQPIVDLKKNAVIGMEALVRWNHPRRGTVSPADFIKIAEHTNAIVPLGTWVMRAACTQLALWQHVRAESPSLTMTVNVSPHQLTHPAFLDDVRAALADAGLVPAQLVLEITESALVDDTPEILAIFRALKDLGVRLAIDDFGTGYSSLSYLQRFPFDILKIDKAFVDGVAGGGSDAAFARTIIALGDMLRLRVLAEGIEHPTQLSTLKELGCEYGQGYLFAKPLDAGAMTSLLETPGTPVTAAAHG